MTPLSKFIQANESFQFLIIEELLQGSVTHEAILILLPENIQEEAGCFKLLLESESQLHKIIQHHYELIFDQILENGLVEYGIILKIISIVSRHKEGLSSEFIEQTLKKAIFNAYQVLELDLKLLQLKLQNRFPSINEEYFKSKISLHQHPYLTPILLFIFMRKRPELAMGFIWRLDEVDWEITNELKRHFDSYIFITLYNYLTDRNRLETFVAMYLSLEKKWIRDCINRCLEKKSFSTIKEELKRKIDFIQSEIEPTSIEEMKGSIESACKKLNDELNQKYKYSPN